MCKVPPTSRGNRTDQESNVGGSDAIKLIFKSELFDAL